MLCRFNAVEQDYNEHIFNKTTGKLTEHVINPKISNMTTGNLTEHFQEFTQGDCMWLAKCSPELMPRLYKSDVFLKISPVYTLKFGPA